MIRTHRSIISENLANINLLDPEIIGLQEDRQKKENEQKQNI